MTIHYQDDAVTLHAGDCLDVLRALPEASVDAVVTDPPYGLEFMGRDWDGPTLWREYVTDADKEYVSDGRNAPKFQTARPSYAAGLPFQRWCEQWAAECLRVLKPGGHLLAFGGSRTWHRLACAIEDAGFEIRDSIAWLYGSGFPKSLDVSKAIDRAAGAEREVVGVKWAEKYPNGAGGNGFHGGVGRTADGSRTEPEALTAPATDDARKWQGWGTALKPAFEPIVVARKPLAGTVAATVLEHGTGALNIDASRVGSGEDSQGPRGDHEATASARYTERGAVNLAATPGPRGGSSAGRWPPNVVLDGAAADELDQQSGTLTSGRLDRAGIKAENGIYGVAPKNRTGVYEQDSGGASRFFPTFRYEPKAGSAERPRDGETAHPTVKPLTLMQWLVKLVTPPGGTVLEPFAGSGTTAEACVIEGFKCIAIERDETYLPLIVARLTKPIQVGLDFGEPA